MWKLSSLIVAIAWTTIVVAELSAPIPLSPNALDSNNETQALDGDRAANVVARHWEITKPADNEMWNTFVGKGERLKCLMEASDKGAGSLLLDTRKPPSAASKWTGDLTGWYSEPIMTCGSN